MKWRCLAVVAVGCLLGAALSVPARAQDTDNKGKEEFYGTITRDIFTAAELADFGKKHKAPEAYLAAAGLLLKVHAYTDGKPLPTLEPAGEPEVPKKAKAEEPKKGKRVKPRAEKGSAAKGAPAKAEASQEPTFQKQAEDLFKAARGLKVMKSRELEEMIRAVKARTYTLTKEYKEYKAFAGRSIEGGPKQISRKVQVGGSHSYMIRFQANEPAAVALKSDVPVRIRVGVPGKPLLLDTIVTTSRFTWTPEGNLSSNVKVEVQSKDKAAQYTFFAN